VGGGDEGVADGDDLLPRLDAARQQSEVQRDRAVRNRDSMPRAAELREFPFKSRDFWPLRHPARAQDARHRLFLESAEGHLGQRDAECAHLFSITRSMAWA